jgi:translation initiation factor IF-2
MPKKILQNTTGKTALISQRLIERPPVIVVMGHIDHGKSTLLDYIRKSNIVAGEAGGITQHIGAYEVIHANTRKAKNVEGKGTTEKIQERRITFLDTPGHAAFKGIRNRGANTADIAILVVSSEEGVKPQTTEALQSILTAKIPYIVAITKIDSPKADIERIKQNLAENEIYLESYGGQIPWVAVSAKTGEGVDDLLDLLLLQAELGELRGDPNLPAKGIIIEANLDKRKGNTATLIIKNGTLRDGMAVVIGDDSKAGGSIAPVRVMEDFLGKRITEATFSSPIRLIGFDTLPKIGQQFQAYATKKEAEQARENALGERTDAAVQKQVQQKNTSASPAEKTEQTLTIPLIIKADVAGTLEAIESELKKIHIGETAEKVELRVVQSGCGDITENDIKSAVGHDNILVIGFNCRIDAQAKATAERLGIEIHSFDIIYKLMEWLEKTAKSKAPKMQIEEITGRAKIQKIFSKNKDKQVVGGKVLEGVILSGSEVRILRRDAQIGEGKIRELQQQKQKASEAKKDTEFGTLIESKIEIAPGDQIQAVRMVEK